MPKEEKLPEDSKNSPLNPANSLSPTIRNPVSTHTAVSRDFSPSVPGTSSSALVGTKSTKSSHHEVKFQMQRTNEGIFKNSDSQPMCFFLLKVSLPNNIPRECITLEKVPRLRSLSPPCLCYFQGQATTDPPILMAA